MTLTRLVFSAWAAWAACSTAVQAAPVLDASYAGGGGTTPYAFRLNAVTPALAQTFTAGTTGALTGYGLFIAPLPGAAATITVALTTAPGGSPNGGTVLAQRAFGTGAITTAGFYDFDVASAGATVLANGVYALVASVQTAELNVAAGLGGDYPDSFGGGQAYFGPPGALQPAADTALFFRTFVAPSPATSVPEPATLLLVGFGALGAGIVRRRREPAP